jgi:hypothetical protein
VLSMVYQVRCNLFHGGKNYSSESDRQFITLAYKILWQVWMNEIPSRFFRAGMPWKRILVRSGFIFSQQGQSFIFSDETQDNKKYFTQLIQYGKFGIFTDDVFKPHSHNIDENLWLNAVDACHSGVEGGSPDELSIMDPYMAGIVRWLNKIGLQTTFSCDGHGQRPPRIEFSNHKESRLAVWVLVATGINVRTQNRNLLFSDQNNDPDIPLQRTFDRGKLLNISEWIHDNMEALSETAKRMRQITLPRFVNTPMQTSVYRRPLRR